MVASARSAAMIATPKPAMPSATTHPLLMLGGRLIAVAQLVTTATVASPLTGARLVGTRSTRLIATPHSTESAANASPSGETSQGLAPLPIGRPMYQVDAQHTGRSPYIGPRQPLLLRTFDTSMVDVPDPVTGSSDIQSSAAIAPDGTAYIGLHSGTLFALRDPVSAGNQLAARWSFHPPGGSSWHATPAIGRDGTVYVGFSTNSGTPDAQGTLFALQAPITGIEPRVLWSVDLGPGRQASSPTIGPDGPSYDMSCLGRG